jgi:N-methylhydantoinase B
MTPTITDEFFLDAKGVEKSYGLTVQAAETLRAGLIETTRHMRDTLMRGAFSAVVREVLDFGVCVHRINPDGTVEMVAVTEGCNHFAFTTPHLVNMVLDEWGIENLGPGDTIVCNDSWRGSIHFSDLNLIRPVFVDGELAFILSDAAHIVDIGGPVPGGFNSTATTMYEEGLRIPPMLITSGDVPVRSTINLIIENTRTPVHTLGDLRALFGTLRVGEQRVRHLVDTHGLESVQAGCDYTLDLAERRMRRAISMVPDREISSDIRIDDDGSGGDDPLRIVASARVAGSHVEIDFSGTDRQALGSMTTCWEETNRCLVGPKLILDPRHPMNSGAMRPFHVVAPAGSLVMGLPPTSQSQHPEVGTHVASLMVGLFGDLSPEHAVAADSGTTSGFAYSGADGRPGRGGRPFAGLTNAGGAWGGTSTADGLSHCSSPIFNVASTNVEFFERDTPMLIRGMSSIIDSAGPGKYRSGVPAYVAFEPIGDPAFVSTIYGCGRFPRQGLRGGRSGTPSCLIQVPTGGGHEFRQWNGLIPVDEWEPVAGRFGTDGHPDADGAWCEGTIAKSLKADLEVAPNTMLVAYISGGGGYGDPTERDPEAVRLDVWNELVTLGGARTFYGVVLDAESLEIDAQATEIRRAEMRAEPAEVVVSMARWPSTAAELDAMRDAQLHTRQPAVLPS